VIAGWRGVVLRHDLAGPRGGLIGLDGRRARRAIAT